MDDSYEYGRRIDVADNECCVDETCLERSSWLLNHYRPKGSLARALYDKQVTNIYLGSFDKTQWYRCDLGRIPQDVAGRFVPLSADDDTLKFLQRSEDKSDWIFTQIWHSLVKSFLGWFMTQTSINGLLQRGSMFVLSLGQFLKLMDKDNYWRAGSLLDLGAGDGEVTANLAPVFESVHVTEVSGPMQNLLLKRGFNLLQVDEWHKGDENYDVISCLNVLDRCDTPLMLLMQIKGALKKNGQVLVAVVLPFSPYVEAGSHDHKPREYLQIKGSSFEEQVTSFTKEVFPSIGLEVVSWTKVPYLCEGDLQQSYYWLDDAVFLLKAAE